MIDLKLSTLITEQQIRDKVKELGAALSDKYKGEQVLALCVLNGSFIFYSDLIREIDGDVKCEFIGLSSYGPESKSSGDVKITLDVHKPIRDKHVLIVEDIIDTGLTMKFLQSMLKERGAKSITTCAFLHKPNAQKIDCDLDHIGFEIANDFVVGYGLDYQGYCRNLPYIAQVQNIN